MLAKGGGGGGRQEEKVVRQDGSSPRGQPAEEVGLTKFFFAILKNTIVIINTKSNKNEEKMERQKVLVGVGIGGRGKTDASTALGSRESGCCQHKEQVRPQDQTRMLERYRA